MLVTEALRAHLRLREMLRDSIRTHHARINDGRVSTEAQDIARSRTGRRTGTIARRRKPRRQAAD